MAMNDVVSALSSISTGPALTFENLTMIPLLEGGTSSADVFLTPRPDRRRGNGHPAPRPAARAGTVDYLLLDDALASGVCEITEVSARGSVPELRVLNRADSPVLIVDGQELAGAKQNRVVNLTILVAPRSELTVPVSCVEAGRWAARSRTFEAAPRAQFASGRAKRMAQVTVSMKQAGDRASDQAEVWNDIAEKCERLRASSPTGAMAALFVDHAAALDRYVEALQPVARQVGALFAIGGRFVGMDLFDRPSTLSRMLPKLVRSVAVDALDSGNPEDPGPPPQASEFLAALAKGALHTAPAVGLGNDVRITAPGLNGAALVVESAIVHLMGFSV